MPFLLPLWCKVEASAAAARAGLCEEPLFDVPSVASSHEVQGEVMHSSQGQNLLSFITLSARAVHSVLLTFVVVTKNAFLIKTQLVCKGLLLIEV